jgi:flagellar basal-body rod modification protein FlgD
MVDSVTNASSANASQNSGFGLVSGNQQQLGKNEFLKLLVEQLKHQDPLKPQDDSAFVAQLAQFSNLEQTMQTNTNLATIMTELRGQANAQVTSLVGKTATIQGSVAALDGRGNGAPITFMLNSASAATKATIRDSSGNTVRVLDLGARNAGITQVTWDGRNLAGNLQPAGNYSISVAATGSNGGPVSVSQNISGLVSSLSFDQGYPVLNLQNGISAPVSELIRVESPPSNP